MATRIVRWIGHPSPFDDHNVRRRLERGTLHPEVALAFTRFEHNRRFTVRRGAGSFTIGPQQGYTREYQWGPVYYDVEMDERDFLRLWRNPLDRHMFIDVTNGVPKFRPLLTRVEWRELIKAMDSSPEPQTVIMPGFYSGR